MFTAYVVIAVITAVVNAAAAAVDFVRPGWVVENLTRTGLTDSWLFPLGVLKGAGAAGLLLGFVVPAIGLAAASGLVLYFAGAIVAVARVRWYSHIPFPAALLALAAGALVSQVAAT